MKKSILGIFLVCFLFLVPAILEAEGLVPCTDNCTLDCFFVMLANIYNFIVVDIAIPLATVSIIIGAIFILTSAGNPGQMGKGKTIITAAIIGLALTLGSYAIVNFILSDMLGYKGGFGQSYSCGPQS